MRPPPKWLLVTAIGFLLLLAAREAAWHYDGYRDEWRRNLLTNEVQLRAYPGAPYETANPQMYGRHLQRRLIRAAADASAPVSLLRG